MSARVKKGDTVVIISGRDKGKQGTILSVNVEMDTVLVQGANMVWKHQRPSQRQPEGKRFQKEAPLAACKVMPIDPETGKGTRVKFEVKDGKKVRIATKSGAVMA